MVAHTGRCTPHAGHNRSRAATSAHVCSAAVALCVACSGGASHGDGAGALALSAPATLDAGAVVTLSAAGGSQPGSELRWRIVSGGGDLSASSGRDVTFRAPVGPSGSTTRIEVASRTDPTSRASVDVGVLGVELALSVTGDATRIVVGEPLHIVASIKNLATSARYHLRWAAVGVASEALSVSSDSLIATWSGIAPGASGASFRASLDVTDADVTAPIEAVKTVELPPPAPPAPVGTTGSALSTVSDLVINEVGSAIYHDVPAWFEIYNPGSSPVDLGAYTLRARGLRPTDGGGDVPSTLFPLPSVTVPANGYVLVGGRADSFQADGPGVAHVASGDGLVPFWSGSGYLELLRDGRTVDFVRFGGSAEAPTTPAAWRGGSAPALPVDAYGSSIGRSVASADTDAAADWVLVGFATPGGRNDVPADARDDDGDGIPSAAKLPGSTFAGVDLYAMGARPGQRDVFVELDHMASGDPGIVPRREALDRVVAAFAAHGIRLHIDAGALFSTAFDPANYNLGQAQPEVPYAPCVTFRGSTAGCAGDLHRVKAQFLELRRQPMFHYALFGSTQRADGAAGASGLSEVNGNDVLVTLGGWGLSDGSAAAANVLVNFQAATLMHEIGHNLNLRHGGDDDVNDKPNYLSVMNYMYQLYGVPDPRSPDAASRYRWSRFQAGDWCNAPGGPCGSPQLFRIDFSDGSGLPLDERALDEAKGVGRSGPAVDYDGNGLVSGTAISFDVNGDGATTSLHDHDDWSSLVLPFSRSRFGQPGSALVASAPRPRPVLSPANDDAQELSVEPEPSAAFLEAVRQASR